MKAFLDIDIGDSARYATEFAAYQRAADWLAAVGAQYGLSGKVEDLDEDSASTLREAYAADPTWAAKGEASTTKPPPIRAGRIIVELYDKEVPKTVENFKCLLTGEKGLGKASKKPLHYQGNKFHRIVKGFCCQGGDIVRGDGSGGDSIYGGAFNDEKPGLKYKHDGPGLLSMANSGKNTNTSQFFFTLAAAPQCDGKHVVFGKVVEGLDVLTRIDAEAASADGTPRVDVTIAACGLC
ncbi:hypothetical protein HYH03_008002 [Edaphochlamys debaryana]|uniref:Peptidyl-prolyl cis-trans isomerase n=1 Tax=Edaphochlamys debaryana TaxID=47281 RepID=A0A836BZC0_9CHLO|nr:hypothetical protein HYH03_008002 [Edaphochlamys debaryana]|eukprot:KAG2493782.1 hypothetical protein HYH03_008002 [Edaphochlamys debaryana]